MPRTPEPNEFEPWSIRHIDITRDIPSLEAEPNRGGLFVVLWWRSVPVAHIEVDAHRLPMRTPAVRQEIVAAIAPTVAGYLHARRGRAKDDGHVDLTGFLTELNGPLDQLFGVEQWNGGRDMNVSVVICTRDRPLDLARCIESLSLLTKKPRQILVVDNASTNEKTKDYVASRSDVDYVAEAAPGLDRARNAGVRHSTGEIVAFVDDDVTVHEHWLERIERSFSDDSTMAVTGLILPSELETQSQYVFEKEWGFNRGYVPRTFDTDFYAATKRLATPVWEIGAGANMAFRRAAFHRVGGFDHRLDAGAAGVAGDSEFWYRLLANGWTCRYDPSAVVFHRHRREMEALKSQLYFYMRGHVTALLVQNRRYGDRGNLRRLLTVLPQYYAETMLRAVRPKNRRRASTLRAELAGCAAGLGYYLRTRRLADDSVPDFPDPR